MSATLKMDLNDIDTSDKISWSSHMMYLKSTVYHDIKTNEHRTTMANETYAL